MDLSMIPIVILATFLILSAPQETNSSQTKVLGQKKQSVHSSQESQRNANPYKALPSWNKNGDYKDNIDNEDIEYKTIYRYITSVFKKVNKEEAKQIAENIIEYSKKYNLDPKLATALIARESAFNKEAISVTGAKGLGQIKNFNFKDLKIKNPHDIQQNVRGTVKYLKSMITKWKGDSKSVSKGLASYYKGYTAVKTAPQVDNPTKHYVRDILKYYDDLEIVKKQIQQQ